MVDYIIGTDSFRQNLDNWLFKNDQTNANFLNLNKNRIPNVFRSYTQRLYRGMYIDDDQLNKIETSGSITLDKHTSWSKDQKLAEKFITDDSFALRKVNKIKILLTKTISPTQQILDIDAFVLFMGAKQLIMLGYDETNIDSALKEKEVLVSRGVRVTKNNVKVLD